MRNRKIQVIAHRGASAWAPENTAAAFDRAIEVVADSIETDIRASNDGRLVLIHDASADRTSDGEGLVSELSYSELSRLDFGGWFDNEFRGEGVFLLEEFLDRYAGRIHLTLEIKVDGIEEEFARVIKNCSLDPGGYSATSFNPEHLLKVTGLLPGVFCGLLVKEFSEKAIQFCLRNSISQICPPASSLHPETVRRARSLGLTVRAWGVHDIAIMKHAVKTGVDGMTVNFPEKLAEYIRGGSIPES